MKIAIVGGGASGLAAAVTAAQYGARVTIFEKNARVGKKILATGNGRCNFTNAHIGAQFYHSNAPDVVSYVLEHFGTKDALDFFGRLFVPASCKDGLYYPSSMQAASILDALRIRADELGVKTVCGTTVTGIRRHDADFMIEELKKPCTNREISDCHITDIIYDRVILSGGGIAAPSTGSDGGVMQIAMDLGHNVYKPMPALVALKCSRLPFAQMAGARCRGKVMIYANGRLECGDTGEIQFTKQGLSGIPVMQVSYAASVALDAGKDVCAKISLLPDITKEDIIKRVFSMRAQCPKRMAQYVLLGLLPKNMSLAVLKLCGIGMNEKISALTDTRVRLLADSIKCLVADVYATAGPESAQTTYGGVSLLEINPDTMESRKVSGLHMTGELLDADGICGGYNLHWAWATGHAAGLACAKVG